MSRLILAVSALMLSGVVHAQSTMQHSKTMHEPRLGFFQAERLEYRDESGNALWDLQGWYGSDYNKLWIKTEGALDDGQAEHAELQVLYSRAWSAFFDLQFGLRVSDIDDGDVVSAVAGIQGVAPYRVELDAALFVSEDGDASIRAEFERDVFLNEQVILQPRAELHVAFSDVPELGIGSGLSELSLGLRLRYDVTRKFAPYIGLEHERSFGDTADLLEAAGLDSHETTLLAGVRFWF